MSKLSVEFCGIKFKNPVVTASGTFGSGIEYNDLIDLNKLGGITVKGVSKNPWKGNPPSRIAETYSGMLNSVGLQNNGVDYFIKNDLEFLANINTKVIVNVCGHTIEDYLDVISALKGKRVDIFELNISCPNINAGGLTFGKDPLLVEKIVSESKKIADKPVIAKLTPNVSDITEIAKAAESGGADGLSLINTLIGMRIDINKKAPMLHNKIGGLSGPCIKPVALAMVYQVCNAVKIPVIGMGGILDENDAIEFIMAGATLIAVGTANFINPMSTLNIIKGLEQFLNKNNYNNITEIKGVVNNEY